jgi:hypothetical protein
VIRILTIIALLFATPALSHGGRTNAEGCHNERATGGYHCHSPKSNSSLGSKFKNEAFFNTLLANKLLGQEETRHNYSYSTGSSFIRVDIETDDFVIEGGLDKRSSLDSLQQALFAAQLTGKTPVVVIYDTDGEEGRFEFRVKIAAKAAGVKYFNLSEKNILDFKGLK